MPMIKHYDVTVTVRMKVAGPVTYAGAVALATESVQMVPAQSGLGKVSGMEVDHVSIDG
jgi:hypothetical protein